MEKYTKYLELKDCNDKCDELVKEFKRECIKYTRYAHDILALYRQFLEYNICLDVKTVIEFWYEASESYSAVFLDVRDGSLAQHLLEFEWHLQINDSPSFVKVYEYIATYIEEINFNGSDIESINDVVSKHISYCNNEDIKDKLSKLYPIKKNLDIIKL